MKYWIQFLDLAPVHRLTINDKLLKKSTFNAYNLHHKHTKARPKPLRPQFAWDNFCFNASAMGETKFVVGNISVSQTGH